MEHEMNETLKWIGLGASLVFAVLAWIFYATNNMTKMDIAIGGMIVGIVMFLVFFVSEDDVTKEVNHSND